jgi:hypothetical protein
MAQRKGIEGHYTTNNFKLRIAHETIHDTLCCYEWFLFVHNLNTTNKNWLWFSYIFQLKINPKNYVQIKTTHINHNEQINKQNIDNSKCFGVKYVKIYPEMTSQ